MFWAWKLVLAWLNQLQFTNYSQTDWRQSSWRIGGLIFHWKCTLPSEVRGFLLFFEKTSTCWTTSSCVTFPIIQKAGQPVIPWTRDFYKEVIFTLSLTTFPIPSIWLHLILELRTWSFYYIWGEKCIRKTLVSFTQINFMRLGWLKSVIQTKFSFVASYIRGRRGQGCGGGHEVSLPVGFQHLIVKILKNLSLLRKKIPLKYWPSVSRVISAIVVYLLDTIINWTFQFLISGYTAFFRM